MYLRRNLTLKNIFSFKLKFHSIFQEFLLFRDSDSPRLSFGHAGKLLTVPFEPGKLCMEPETGRVYHPGPNMTGGIGLVSDKLNIQWTTVSTAMSKLMREALDLPSGKYH